jgi:SpoVK/Ycf46/Vps4 family AAA+-type ATPase
MNALRNDPESEETAMEDFEEALKDVRATATDENLQMYREMAKKMNNIDQQEDDQPDYYA